MAVRDIGDPDCPGGNLQRTLPSASRRGVPAMPRAISITAFRPTHPAERQIGCASMQSCRFISLARSARRQLLACKPCFPLDSMAVLGRDFPFLQQAFASGDAILVAP